MDCCGGHGDNGGHKGKEHHEESCGKSKLGYMVVGLIILLAVIFIWKYFK